LEKVTIRLYEKGDDEGIVELLDLVFDGWPNYDITYSPLEHWRWKYLGFEGTPYISVAEDGGIVGCNLGYRVSFRVSGKSITGYYAADTAVHPDYRGKRISSRIIEYQNNHFAGLGAKFTYWGTSNPIYISYGKRRARPLLPFKITNFVRILDIDKQLQAMPVPKPFLNKAGYTALKTLNTIRNSLEKCNRLVPKFEIREIDKFPEEINLLTEAVATNHPFMVERGQEYLNWRYTDPRAGKFTVKTAYNPPDGEILGCCVIRVNRIRWDYPVGFIMELMALPSRFDVVDELLKHAVTYFDLQGVNIVNVLASDGHNYRRILNRNGFLDSRVEPYVFINSLVNEAIIPRKTGKPGYFTFGDLDSLPTQMPQPSTN
jgi:GNAT superfamily N-acetyltransferase